MALRQLSYLRYNPPARLTREFMIDFHGRSDIPDGGGEVKAPFSKIEYCGTLVISWSTQISDDRSDRYLHAN